MAVLHKKVEKLVNSTKGRLRKTLVETNLEDYTKSQARLKGFIFYNVWKGHFDFLYEVALEEDGRRKLADIITKKGR